MTGAPVTNLTKVEREVIGCIMGSERAVSEALEMLRDDDLQTGACRLILQAARAISARGHQVDLMSVTAWLKENHPKIEKIEVNLAA
ncbi:MAG: hypothetical protein GY719_10025, partial [bacterium]|nr:hypothetical protein [bacterium]